MGPRLYPSIKVYVPVAKIEDYLLNPAYEHCKHFKAAGYERGNGYRLFKELERRYDRAKAFDFVYGIGYVQYSVSMDFSNAVIRTVWREDSLSSLPRFITAYIDRRIEHG